MKYNFDELVNRKNTDSLKWDAPKKLIEWGITNRFDDETIPLFTADMDIAVAPPIVEAMHRTADRRIYGYSSIPDRYYQTVIDWFDKRHNLDILQEEIVYCPGTVHALGVAINAFTKEGDGVIIQRPVYSPFTTQIVGNNRVVANNQLIRDEETGNYSINLEEFEELAKKPENKMFILCNPHNPTGKIFDSESLSKMAEICYENDVLIVADEIHGDLIRTDKTFIPILKTTDKHDHIIMCSAINKTFNVAGLHASNIVIKNPDLRLKFKMKLGFALPTPFTINAVISAYTECDEWLEQIKTYFDSTIDWLMSFLKERMPKVKFIRPEGTYIFWMDFRGYGISKEEIKKRIYSDANVVLESGTMFDPDLGAGFERVCLSSPKPLIKQAFERIAKAFEDLN